MIRIDMPMPDNCVECRFNVSEFGYCNAMPVEFCGRVNDFEEDGKPEWCPLKAQEPRVHGRWLQTDGAWSEWYYRCSVCKHDWFIEDGTMPADNDMNYCPNCGAKMIGDDNG